MSSLILSAKESFFLQKVMRLIERRFEHKTKVLRTILAFYRRSLDLSLEKETLHKQFLS